MPLIANFFHIKSTNGLLYYGLDYLNENSDAVCKILVRRSLYEPIVKAFPNKDVVICETTTLVREVYSAALRGYTIYTPTPHPMPFVSNQWIVAHDAYPFTVGRLARLKKLLLKLSLATSSCQVAYINKSETLPFLLDLGLNKKRCHFAPNKFPAAAPALPNKHIRRPGDIIIVALVGTESTKKNYASLFDQIIKTGAEGLFKFHIYGHKNNYLDALCSRYPDIRIDLFESDKYSLPEFFTNVDILVSVAIQEGFGRPIASALLLELPCFLLSRPVFKEFFNPGALFFNDEKDLVRELIYYSNDVLPKPSYSVPSKVLKAYASAVAQIFGTPAKAGRS